MHNENSTVYAIEIVSYRRSMQVTLPTRNHHNPNSLLLLFEGCAHELIYNSSKPGLFWSFPSLLVSRNLTRIVYGQFLNVFDLKVSGCLELISYALK